MSSVRGWHYLQTLPGLVKKAAQDCPERPFIHCIRPTSPEADPEVITFAELEERVRRATAFLQEKGLKAGDRVLFLAENSPNWQVLALAAQALRVEVASLFASLGTLDVVDI